MVLCDSLTATNKAMMEVARGASLTSVGINSRLINDHDEGRVTVKLLK